MPLDTKVHERVDEIWLSWFLEGSSFEPVRSVVPVVRSAEIDWTGPSSLDTWFTYL